MTVNPTQFDPGRYLRKVNGSDYLEVKWRLLWLRTDHPEASVSTELMSHDGQLALFKATVSVPGGGSSTGWGSEQYNDFRDYIEKAETKAIGRALSALGYGTQFCPDFDFTGGTNKVVDAPIDIQARREESRDPSTNAVSADHVITENQLRFIANIARELGISDQDLQAEVRDIYGSDVATMNRRVASQFIDRLKARKVERGNQATA